MLKFKVTELDAESRIDKFLKRHLSNVPYSLIFKLIRKGAVRVNAKRVKQDYRVSVGDEVFTPNLIQDHIPLQKPSYVLPLNKIYEDESLIVIDKPEGVAVQGGSKQKTNLIEQLEYLYGLKIYPIHRLDKDTSGLIIFGKNNLIAKLMSEKFQSGTISKKYYALISNKPNWNKKTISEDITKDERGETKYLHAVTICQRKKSNKLFTLIEAQPLTGRKHQIRIHLAHCGHPIYGDKKYNPSKEKVKRMFLHASKLIFEHPITHKKVTLISPLPHSFNIMNE